MISARPAPSRPVNFDRVARLYRWAEYALLGPLLQRTRERLLPSVRHARRALVLGDGDGRFLAALLRASPEMSAIAIDSSTKMLSLLQRRCRPAGRRLITLCASVSELPLDLPLRETDLVVTHFLLDCLSQPAMERLATSLAERVAPGALWLISDFAYPVHQPWRMLGKIYIRSLYAAFRLLTSLRTTRLPPVAEALEGAGWHRVQRQVRLKGLLYSELWRLGPKGSLGQPG